MIILIIINIIKKKKKKKRIQVMGDIIELYMSLVVLVSLRNLTGLDVYYPFCIITIYYKF